ncbi:MAG: hypothetical protein U0R18_01025 [Mycobacterium sp.]
MNTSNNTGLRAVFGRNRGKKVRHDAPCRMRYLDDSRMRREMGHL